MMLDFVFSNFPLKNDNLSELLINFRKVIALVRKNYKIRFGKKILRILFNTIESMFIDLDLLMIRH